MPDSAVKIDLYLLRVLYMNLRGGMPLVCLSFHFDMSSAMQQDSLMRPGLKGLQNNET